MPAHWAHVPIPFAGQESSIAIVIGGLVHEHARRQGRSSVVMTAGRDWVIPEAVNLPVDYLETCPRDWFSRRETWQDHLLGAAGATRPHFGRIQRPAMRALEALQPDAVFIHDGLYALASAPEWKRHLPNAARFLYLHNPMSRSFTSRELRSLFAALDGVIFVSEDARRRLAARIGRGLPPSAVIHNGLDETIFHAHGRGPRPRGVLRITFAGQVVEHKGPHLMMRAVASAGLGDTALLRIVGSGNNLGDAFPTGYERALRTLADRLGLRVDFVTRQPQLKLAAILRSSDMVCVPSVWEEPFGMAAIEAMACGAAVIAANRGGLPEACGHAARLIDPEDPDEFGSAVREMCDDTTRRHWQDMGRDHAKRMTWSNSYDSLSEAVRRWMR